MIPEAAVLDSGAREPGARGEPGGTDHRRERQFAPAHRIPTQASRHALGEPLWVEDGDRPEPRWQAAAAAARFGWSRFEEDVILLPVEEDADGLWHGALLNPAGARLELSYSKRLGLMVGSEASEI